MKKITVGITGMHCASCAMNIDGELEDTAGVSSSSTNYAKQETHIEFDPKKISEAKLLTIINSLGYQGKPL